MKFEKQYWRSKIFADQEDCNQLFTLGTEDLTITSPGALSLL